jgi:hypothetical protein
MHFAGDNPQTSEGDGSAPGQGACSRAVCHGALVVLLSYDAAAAATPDVWRSSARAATG